MNTRYKNIIACCFLGCLFFAVSCKQKKATEVADGTAKKEVWTCPMHPEVIKNKPGSCPICGMDLIKKQQSGAAIHDIQLDDLLQPTDRFVISSVPVVTAEKKSEPVEVTALGSIVYDTRTVNTISARVSGRIEKLYLKYRYQHIMKGERIMDIYSPELVTAQQELLFVIKNDPNNYSLINAAKQKLLLLGVSEDQLQQIIKTGKYSLTIGVYSNYSGHIHEAGNTMPGDIDDQKMITSKTTEELTVKEGMYVEKGQNIFQVYSMDKSWVLLSIFPEYQAMVKTGDAVRIVPETDTSKNFRAKIDFIEPFFRQENKNTTARVYFENSELNIPVGSQVRATIISDDKEAEWLPKDAILSLGINKVVFLKRDGGFRAHKIETGLVYDNKVQVLSGLTTQDSVAANAQFLADSESFIKVNNEP